MDDERVWAFETSLWTGGAERYHELIDDECLMVVPTPPFVLRGSEAADAVSKTPRWTEVAMTERRVSRPQEGLIVIAYKVEAHRGGDDPYVAHCTSTIRRLDHEVWRVVQHQQTPPLVASSAT